MRKQLTEAQLKSFLSRIVKRDGCWIWQGATGGAPPHMYGVYRGTTAHRVAYGHYVGPLEDGKVIDHLCGVKLCVNPEHLEQVTQAENLLRSPTTINAINAAKTQCVRGHEFTESNTYISKTNGQRVCRLCKRDWARDKRSP